MGGAIVYVAAVTFAVFLAAQTPSGSTGTFGSAAAPLKVPATATVTVTFTPSNPPGDTYIVEQKAVAAGGAVTWARVAAGGASPVAFKLSNPVPGATYTFRVTAQLSTTTPPVLSDPSDEVSCTYRPGKPGNPKATIQ